MTEPLIGACVVPPTETSLPVDSIVSIEMLETPSVILEEVSSGELLTIFEEEISHRNSKARITKGLLSGQNPTQIAKQVYKNTSDLEVSKVNAWIYTIVKTDLEPKGIIREVEVDEKTGLSRNKFLREKQKTNDTSDKRREYDPYEPVREELLAVLETVLKAPHFTTEQIVGMMGPRRDGYKYTWPNAAYAIGRAIHRVRDRSSIGVATEREVQYLDIIRGATGISDPKEAIKEFNRFVRTALKEGRAGTQPEEFDPDKQVSRSDSEYIEDSPQIAVSEDDFAKVAFALFRQRRLSVELEGEIYPFALPEETVNSLREYLNGYKKDIRGESIDPQILRNLQNILSDEQTVLEFIEGKEKQSEKDILYWLEKRRRFVFDILKQLKLKSARNTEFVSLDADEIGEDGVDEFLGEVVDVEDELEQDAADSTGLDELEQIRRELAGIAEEEANADDQPDEESTETSDYAEPEEELDSKVALQRANKVKLEDKVVRNRITAVVGALRLKPIFNNPVAFDQLTSAYPISLQDIRLAIEQGFINRPLGGQIQNMHYSRDEIAIIIMRKELTLKKLSFNKNNKKRLIKIVAEIENELDEE